MDCFKTEDEVLVLGRNLKGKIAFIGNTHFCNNLCYGVSLFEPKGINDGSFDGVRYFRCPENHGIFVKSYHLRKLSQVHNNRTKVKNTIYTKCKQSDYLKNRSFPVVNKTTNVFLTRKTCSDVHFHCLGNTPHLEIAPTLKYLGRNEREEIILAEVKKLILEDIYENKAENNSCLSLAQKSSSQMAQRHFLTKIGVLNNLVVEKSFNKESYAEKSHKLFQQNFKKNIRSNNMKYDPVLEKELNFNIQLENYKKQIYALTRKLNQSQKALIESERKKETMGLTLENLRNITEIAIVEKEISEIKGEELETNLQEMLLKTETLELKLIEKDEEMMIQTENGVPAVHYARQLENRNAVLYNALLKLKKLYISKQDSFLEAQKTIQCLGMDISNLTKKQKGLEDTILNLRKEAEDMRGTIDSLLDVDEFFFEIIERNLNTECELIGVKKTLDILEEQLQVGNEIEEILQELYTDASIELQSCFVKENLSQVAISTALLSLDDQKKAFRNYQTLIRKLQDSNQELEQKLDKVSKERKEAVSEAEKLKLCIYSKNKKSLQEMVRDDIAKLEIDALQEKIKYWSFYFPDNFFSTNEYFALEIRLHVLKMIQKINIFFKHIDQKYFECVIVYEENQLQLLAFRSRFLAILHQLQAVLKIYYISLDHVDVGTLLASNKCYSLIEESHREMDVLLSALCIYEIDKRKYFFSLKNMLTSFSKILNTEDCPEIKKIRYGTECHLQVILLSIKCIWEHTKSIYENGSSPTYKTKLRKLKKLAECLIKISNFLLIQVKTEENNKSVHMEINLENRLRHASNQIQEMMEQTITNYNTYLSNDEDFNQAYFSNDGNLLNLNLLKSEMQSIADLVRQGKYIHIGILLVDSVPSFVSWIKNKKKMREKEMQELCKQIFSYKKEIRNLTRCAEVRERQKVISITKNFSEDKGIQTVSIRNRPESFSKNLFSAVLLLKLQDMESLVKFLRFQLFRMQMACIRTQILPLIPLRLPRKLKYIPDVHVILHFQRQLHVVYLDVWKLLFPTIVDITSKGKRQKNPVKFFCIEREIQKRNIQCKIVKLATEINDFKTAQSFAKFRSLY